MPRHPRLIPLSHDHHEALLIALRLKKGGPTSAHDHLWPTDLSDQLHSLRLFFDRELLPHFILEEKRLFPVAELVEELRPLVRMLLTQHAELREMISRFGYLSQEDEVTPVLLKEFGVALESHIRLEERELFPKLEDGELHGRIEVPELK